MAHSSGRVNVVSLQGRNRKVERDEASKSFTVVHSVSRTETLRHFLDTLPSQVLHDLRGDSAR